MLSTSVLSNENQTHRGREAPASLGGGGCHTYPESGDEDDKYYAEEMIYDEEVGDMDTEHKRIYKKLYRALKERGIV